MVRRTLEPLLWILFSAGGVVAALVIPVLLLLFGIAFPLGWLSPPGHAHMLAVLSHPLSRVTIFGACTLMLFHWAHRFRYTLYDGLQIKHLNELIVLLCYGGVLVGTLAAGYLVWQLPKGDVPPVTACQLATGRRTLSWRWHGAVARQGRRESC